MAPRTHESDLRKSKTTPHPSPLLGRGGEGEGKAHGGSGLQSASELSGNSLRAGEGDGKTMLALDVFRRFAELDPVAARIWLGKLAEISHSVVDAILAEVPPQRLSPVTRELT